MTEKAVTKEEVTGVYPKVAQVIADALGVDVGEVKLDVPLIKGSMPSRSTSSTSCSGSSAVSR